MNVLVVKLGGSGPCWGAICYECNERWYTDEKPTHTDCCMKEIPYAWDEKPLIEKEEG